MDQFLTIVYPKTYETSDPDVQARIQRQALREQIEAALQTQPAVLVRKADMNSFTINRSMVNFNAIQDYFREFKIEVRPLVNAYAFAYRQVGRINEPASEPSVHSGPWDDVDNTPVALGNELVRILMPYAGEYGHNEGAVEVLRRILEEIKSSRDKALRQGDITHEAIERTDAGEKSIGISLVTGE